MKKLFYFISMVTLTLLISVSCSKDNGGSNGGGQTATPFAYIEVVANERCDRNLSDDMYQATTKGGVLEFTKSEPSDDLVIPSINFTVKIDVADDSDTRDYIVLPISATLIENSGQSTLSYISSYLTALNLNLAYSSEVLEMLKMYNVVHSGDIAESANLYEYFPVLPYEPQYVVCIPIEGSTLQLSETSISDPISVVRLYDIDEITIGTEEVECTIDITEPSSFYFSYDLTLNEENNYCFSYLESSLYNSLSAEEVYLYSKELANIGMTVFCDVFVNAIKAYPSIDWTYGKDGDSDSMELPYDNTEYTFYIYNCDDNDDITSKIKSQTFTSSDYVMPSGQLGGFSNLSYSTSDFSVDIDAGTFTADNAIYYVIYFSKYLYGTYFGYTDVESFASTVAAIAMMEGENLTVADDQYTFNGNVEGYEGSELFPASDYVIMAFGISPTGEILTNVISEEFTTESIPADYSIALEQTYVDSSSIQISMTPSQDGIEYIYGIVETSEIEGMSDAELLEYAIIKEEEHFSCSTSFYDPDFDDLTASTSYTTYACVIDVKMELASALYTLEVTTLSEE